MRFACSMTKGTNTLTIRTTYRFSTTTRACKHASKLRCTYIAILLYRRPQFCDSQCACGNTSRGSKQLDTSTFTYVTSTCYAYTTATRSSEPRTLPQYELLNIQLVTLLWTVTYQVIRHSGRDVYVGRSNVRMGRRYKVTAGQEHKPQQYKTN